MSVQKVDLSFEEGTCGFLRYSSSQVIKIDGITSHKIAIFLPDTFFVTASVV
jgi:hypothetical protein